MLGHLLHTSREAQYPVGCPASCWLHSPDRGTPLRDRSRLVEDNRGHFPGTLESLPALDEDAHATGAACRDHHRRWHGEPHRAGTRDDQHGHRIDDGVGEPRLRTDQRPGGKRQHGDRDHGKHKVARHAIGQALNARRLGKRRIVAETGAGQHGVATATACARFGLQCVVYMGAVDVERQKPNVFRMKLLGAEVTPVTSGAGTLKDAMNEALRDWVATCETTFYCIGTVAGPHPYPMMVRDFQCVIGHETREQMQEAEGRLPDSLVACIGGGSNAMGLFYPFLDDPSVKIYGVEAAGRGIKTGEHAASLSGGRPGVLHGNRTYLLQDKEGQITEAHSISAGLDYPGIGPEHSWLKEQGRVEYVSATDDEAVEAFHLLCKLEGIIPALESSHGLAFVSKLAPKLPKDHLLVANLSGRGDKDVPQIAARMGIKI